MRLSIITFAVVASLAVAWMASAGITQTHYGATDPTSEGWTRYMPSDSVGGIPRVIELDIPVASDVGYGGLPAWKIANLTDYGTGNYNITQSSDVTGDAKDLGWKLTAKLRVAQPGLTGVTDPSMLVEFGGYAADFNGRYSMVFGSDASGNALVAGWKQTAVFPVAGDGYHQYDLIDPNGSGLATLYADGVQLATGIPKTDNTAIGRLYFGDGSTGGKSNANYNYVAFETGADLAPTPSPGYATMRGDGVLYTFEQDLGTLITDKLTRDGSQDPIVHNDVYTDSSDAAFGDNSGRFDLPGSGRSYLEIPDSKDLGHGFTLAAMINVDSGELSPTRLFTSYTSGKILSDELIFDIYGTLRFIQSDTTVSTPIPAALQQPGWHHVAATYASGAVAMYVDGSEVVSGTVAGSSVTLTKNLLFGEDYNSIDEQLVGNADDILLVRRALSQSEIAYLATFGAEGAAFLIPEPSSALLLLIGLPALLALARRRRR